MSSLFLPVQVMGEGRPAYKAQAAEMIEDRLPWREIGWQVAPGATGVQHVEDGIENGSQGVG